MAAKTRRNVVKKLLLARFSSRGSLHAGYLRKEKTKENHLFHYSVVITGMINFKTETRPELFEWYPWQFPLYHTELLT